VKEAPAESPYERLVQLMAAVWLVHATELEHLAVGFGAHHWRVAAADHAAYFLALHHLGQPSDIAFQELCQALETAFWLRHVRGLEFVVAPIRNQSGNLVQRFAADSALGVYPWLTCRPRTDLDAPDVGHLLARLHASTCDLPVGLTRHEGFALPWRTTLEQALADLDRPWVSGPYAETTRRQLRVSEAATRDLLAWYDLLVAETLNSRPEWVVAHGQPYGPNLVETDAGQSFLVDWESALLAPRERDLWEMPGSGQALKGYTAMTAATPVERRLRLYRAWYHLAETAVYVHQFRSPHRGDLNDVTAWENFLTFVPVYANWPELKTRPYEQHRHMSRGGDNAPIAALAPPPVDRDAFAA
jgi:hypothetical protein